MIYYGSCLCKSIKFKVVGTFESFYLCHCKYCRKDSGSSHAANLFSSNAELFWLQGEDQVKRFEFRDTKHVKSFCGICGSALPNLQMDNTLLVVPAGRLDVDLDKKADGHIFISNKANWDEDLARVKRFDGLPIMEDE